MFIQKQEGWPYQGCHQQGERLALAPREQTDGRVDTFLETHSQLADRFSKRPPPITAQRTAEPSTTAAAAGERQILRDAQIGSGTGERVLEHPADTAGTPLFRPTGDFLAFEVNPSRRGGQAASNGIQQAGLARAVRTEHDSEGCPLQLQIDSVQGSDFTRRALVKDLRDTLQA